MGLYRQSGTSKLDVFGQFLVKRTLDVLEVVNMTHILGYSCNPRELISGKICDEVQEMLGTDRYEKLCKLPTILKNIHYCQSGMPTMDKSHNLVNNIPLLRSSTTTSAHLNPPPSILNHDYLILEVGYGVDMTETLYIRAEKTMVRVNEAAIVITVDTEFERTDGQALLVTIRCLDKTIRLRDLQWILAEHSPDYSLRDNNCWKYARWTARRLLQECRKDRSHLSLQAHRFLQEEEETMESRVARSHVKRMALTVNKKLSNLWKSPHHNHHV